MKQNGRTIASEARFAGRERGIALVMVVFVIGLAATLGMAVLSSSSLQAMASSNSSKALQARYLAESGINIAAYKLYEASAVTNGVPSALQPVGLWTGGTFTLGSTPGTIEIVVRRDTTVQNLFYVTSTGRTSNDGQAVAHTSTAKLVVEYQFVMDSAIVTRGSVSLKNAKVDGDGGVVVDGTLTATLTADISTSKFARSYIGSGNATIITSMQPPREVVTPSSSMIRDYSRYAYGGSVYNATVLANSTVLNPLVLQNVTLQPTVSNPAGIFVVNGPVTLKSNVQIKGTLIARGQIVVGGTNNKVEAQPGFPAIVAYGDIRVDALLLSQRKLTAEGLVWTNGSIERDGLLSVILGGSEFRIDGGLIMANPAAIIDSALNANLLINYKSDKLNVPDFTSVCGVPMRVRRVEWVQ